jgi:hypothetical protein
VLHALQVTPIMRDRFPTLTLDPHRHRFILNGAAGLLAAGFTYYVTDAMPAVSRGPNWWERIVDSEVRMATVLTAAGAIVRPLRGAPLAPGMIPTVQLISNPLD